MADYTIPNVTEIVDGDDNYSFLNPGDRLFIRSDRTDMIIFRNITGASGNEIIIMNCGGQVTIDASGEGDWLCVDLYNCEHIRFTGTGDPNVVYGIVLTGFTNCGLFARWGTRYVEIDHVEIHTCSGDVGAGLRAHSEVDNVPVGWIQHNTSIHHCYIHDINLEAMYVGKADWQDGTELRTLDIYGNLIEDCGWDGIQVRNARQTVSVHHNIIRRVGDGIGETGQGGAGLIIGYETVGDWYTNWIDTANRGVQFLDAGDNVNLYNNVIIDGGYSLNQEGGIRIFDGGTTDVEIYNNTIVNSYDYGIRVSANLTGSIHDNIVAGWVGQAIDNTNPNVTESNNLEEAVLANVKFVNAAGDDYHLQSDSPAVDAGSGAGFAPRDYDYIPRPQGDDADIGAFEFIHGVTPATATAVVAGTYEEC